MTPSSNGKGHRPFTPAMLSSILTGATIVSLPGYDFDFILRKWRKWHTHIVEDRVRFVSCADSNPVLRTTPYLG